MKTEAQVTLVGAGCSSGLITVDGLKAIRQAEVIVYDALLDERLLGEVNPSARLIFVGKRKGAHSMAQEEINEILKREALSEKRVVRLKGGDPFVFGRGGEEAEFLKKEGIRVADIPGVSSCVAGPEHFGIPVTHRGMASSFTVVTAHGAGGKSEDYGTLAKLRGTLVFLMGLSKAEEISEKLIAFGKSPDTSVSILSRCFREDEVRAEGKLAELGTLAKGIAPPAIIVVGDVASLHLLDEDRPGKNVLVVGTKRFVERQEKAILAKEGGRMGVIKYPVLDVIHDPGNLPESFKSGDCLAFSSAYGVRLFFEEMRSTGRDLRELMDVKFACVGPGTASELKDHGFNADFIPGEYYTRALGKLLAERPDVERVLLIRSRDANHDIDEELEKKGKTYGDHPIYHTEVTGRDLPMPENTDSIIFGSGSGVDAFLSLHPNYFKTGKATPLCIGYVTAAHLFERTGIRAELIS